MNILLEMVSVYGMELEFLEHIFEPFTRAENSITNKVQGTGLGMAIIKNIVDLMNGEIHVKSTPGKGSRFEVLLALKIDQETESELEDEHILLISDDEVLVRNMKAPLSLTHLKLTVVSTEEEAERFLEKKTADVILLAGHLRDKTLAARGWWRPLSL